jgi:phosphoribosylformimino-5-aminoimidazole carboxamide ribotide isomerase
MTRRLAERTGLRVIASGGVNSIDDVNKVKAAGLDGLIIGRALYDGKVSLEEALKC